MRIQVAATILLAVLSVSCGSAKPRTTRAPDADGKAIWLIDDEANIAYPVCPLCIADADRGGEPCADCGKDVVVAPKQIACPECKGSKVCTHCGAGARCVACVGTGHCAICDGTGKWHGEACPECDGAATCRECCPAVPDALSPEACERCAGTNACANCEAIGSIQLR